MRIRKQNFLHSLIYAGFPADTAPLELRRVAAMNVALIFCSIAAFGFTLSSILRSDWEHVVTNGITLASILSVFLLIRLVRRVQTAATIAAIAAILLAADQLIRGGASGSNALWCFLYPPAIAFLLGHKRGALLSASFWLFAVIMLAPPSNPFLTHNYSLAFRWDFIAALGVIIIISVYYEYLRNKVERQVHDQEAFYRTLIVNGASVYTVANAEADFTFISPSSKTVFGYEPKDLLGMNVFAHVHPEDKQLAEDTFRQVCKKNGNKSKIELRFGHKNGGWRDIDVCGLNMLDDPAIGGVVIVSHDISARKEVERDLRHLNENLEQRVRKRTEELRKKDEQLLHAEKMRAIGQLAGGIAHDFNNQLTGILGCAEWICSNSAESDERRDHAALIVSAARNSSRLTSQLLTFAQKRALRFDPININKVVTNAISLLERSLDKKITLSSHLDPGIRIISGDPSQVENAVLNLALNARDAMPNGGSIAFDTFSKTFSAGNATDFSHPLAPGEYTAVRVTDNGTGIAPQTLEHIFEPFFTTKDPGQGTGMGLAGVYAAMEAHHGAVAVESELHSGTRFTLYFPAGPDAAEKKKPKSAQAELKSGKASVLIIDDDPGVRRMSGMVLKGLGYSVRACKNGEEGIRTFQSNRSSINIVLLDMIMPGKSGPQTFNELQQIDPNVRVVLFSGYSMDSDTQQLLNAGARAFVQKPFEIKQLIAAIERALDPSAMPA